MTTKKSNKREERVEHNNDGDYTHIAVVLDRSGSMQSTYKDTVGGFEKFLEDQKKEDGKATISIYQFDTEYDAICEMQDVQDCVGIKDAYIPRGGTALHDAICRTINNTDEAVDNMDDDDVPQKIICVIITDGGENASRRFGHNDVNDMISARRDENWEFVFIGANQDSFSVGGGMGIRAGNTLDYEATSVGTQALYHSMSRSISSARGKTYAAFKSDTFFEKEEEEDKPNSNTIGVDLDN